MAKKMNQKLDKEIKRDQDKANLFGIIAFLSYVGLFALVIVIGIKFGGII